MGIKLNVFTGQLDIVGTSGGGGGGPAERFIDTFNNTTDWGAASGGFYTITVSQGTHGRGANPSIQVFEQNGSDYDMVTIDTIRVDASGNVSLKVPDSPDNRFTGLVLII
jgi:hypothetical protein